MATTEAMKKLAQRFREGVSGTERLVDPDALQSAEVLFGMLSEPETLKYLFLRLNKLAIKSVRLNLVEGPRDDFPQMVLDEKLILAIWTDPSGNYYFEIRGVVDLESVEIEMEIGSALPNFSTRQKLESWLENKYQEYNAEILEFNSTWEARLVRTMTPEKLAVSHGSKLDEVLSNLGDIAPEEPKRIVKKRGSRKK